MRLQLHFTYPIAQHHYPAKIAVIAHGSKFKIKRPPETQVAPLVAPKPDAAQVNTLIQQLHLHGTTVALGRIKSLLFRHQSAMPVIAAKRNQREPENRR